MYYSFRKKYPFIIGIRVQRKTIKFPRTNAILRQVIVARERKNERKKGREEDYLPFKPKHKRNEER